MAQPADTHFMRGNDSRPAATTPYIIQGGLEGFDRLKVLARVMQPTTTAAFDRLGIGSGWRCLDVGSGTGDVTFDLAQRVGPTGHVLGVDLDEIKLGRAREEATARGLMQVAFEHGDVTACTDRMPFDLIYVRFVLTHVTDPAALVAALGRQLRPDGLMLVEDIDFSGSLCYPPSPAHDQYEELYCATAMSRGVDPNIGPRLPGLLSAAGLDCVGTHAVQPMAVMGEAKLLPALTMHAIGPAVVSAQLATADEIDQVVRDLFALAHDSTTLMGMPRVIQAWGTAPGAAA